MYNWWIIVCLMNHKRRAGVADVRKKWDTSVGRTICFRKRSINQAIFSSIHLCSSCSIGCHSLHFYDRSIDSGWKVPPCPATLLALKDVQRSLGTLQSTDSSRLVHQKSPPWGYCCCLLGLSLLISGMRLKLQKDNIYLDALSLLHWNYITVEASPLS